MQSKGDLRPEEVPDRFVLFVATIEGRKNHDLLLRIWHRMVAEGDDPPHLVCVGRVGWRSSTFISALVETDYLDGRIHLLRDISDTDLQSLYQNCLFTVCPTFYEGWGLPIGESLAMGKVCISSDRASVPEVAGEFGTYIDIDDFEGSLAAVRDIIADAPKRKRLEAKIRRGYKPVTWRSVADKVVEACREAAKAKWQEPYPYTSIAYSSEISFARLARTVDGTGEMVLSRIASARRGLFLGESLDDRAFLRGEEVRTTGNWAYPEDWGTWACHSGAEIVLALPHNDSIYYYVFVRLRASGPVVNSRSASRPMGMRCGKAASDRGRGMSCCGSAAGSLGWLAAAPAHPDRPEPSTAQRNRRAGQPSAHSRVRAVDRRAGERPKDAARHPPASTSRLASSACSSGC